MSDTITPPLSGKPNPLFDVRPLEPRRLVRQADSALTAIRERVEEFTPHGQLAFPL